MAADKDLEVDPTAILEVQDLTRDFGRFRAVDGVSFRLQQGSITGLIGPNGAGKSTLFNTLTGALQPSAGRVTLKGDDVTGKSPADLFARGLARTHQIPRPFARMSVLENLMVAPIEQVGEGVFGPFFTRRRMAEQEQAIRDKALEVLEFTTLLPLADHPAGKISGGQKKLLELARILMGEPSIILLDEPAAGVNPQLTRILIDRIEQLNRQGTTFLIVEHDMDFVMGHCERVLAMVQGRLVFEGAPEAARRDPVLLDAYLGAVV